jgi:hypothetical protein
MGFIEWLFGDVNREHQKPEIIKEEPKTDIVKEFVLKDKYQLLEQGYDKFYFVDDKLNTYGITKHYSNIYTWRSAKVGDKIRQTTIYSTKYKYYLPSLKYDLMQNVVNND